MVKSKLADQVSLTLYVLSLLVITAGVFRAYF